MATPRPKIQSLPTQPGSAGMGLIEVMVALGLTTALGLVIAQFATTSQNSVSSIAMQQDAASIARTIQEQIDCSASLDSLGSPPVCNGQYINLYARASGGNPARLLVGAAGQTAGRFTVKAQCQPNRLMISIGRLKPGKPITTINPADFYNDPLTKAPMDWEDLYPEGAPCETKFHPFQVCTGRTYYKGTFSVPFSGASRTPRNFRVNTFPCHPVAAQSGVGSAYDNGNSTWGGCAVGTPRLGAYDVTIGANHFGGSPVPRCYANYMVIAE